MIQRGLVHLLCTYVVWHMFVVDREYKYEPMGEAQTQVKCVDRVKPFAKYEKRHGPLVWYADLNHPSHWYGCFPKDYDPREK